MKRVNKWKRVRQIAGARSNAPVAVVPGDIAPHVEGEVAHHVTKNGTWISHPKAYAKKGASNMRYVSSTYRVVVGRDWLVNNLTDDELIDVVLSNAEL